MSKLVKKGIVLAGGNGSRLYPLTQTVCKQLLPVYDKPLIYYPLSTLIQLGLNDILIISTPRDLPKIQGLFGDGSSLGIRISYEEQKSPDGIAQAFIIGKDFIGNDPVALILGDNIFYGMDNIKANFKKFSGGGLIFGYQMKNPERYGVLVFDEKNNPIAIEEKPEKPKSNYAVTGFYMYDSEVVEIAEKLMPSERGELEISDVNNAYLKNGKLKVAELGRGVGWFDTGTFDSLLEANNFIATIEKRRGVKIGCVEEAAFRMNCISKKELIELADRLPDNSYRDYVLDVMNGSPDE